MPASNFTRINLGLLHPSFREKVLALNDALSTRGFRYVATSGYRSWDAQEKLYAQGRTDLTKPIVTRAKAGQSAHNYGMAVDFVLDVSEAPGVQPAWNKESYSLLADTAREFGLHPGMDFNDPPHVQVANFDYRPLYVVLNQCRILRKSEMKSLRTVWDSLTTKKGTP